MLTKTQGWTQGQTKNRFPLQVIAGEGLYKKVSTTMVSRFKHKNREVQSEKAVAEEVIL